jgi:hypothetical protein
MKNNVGASCLVAAVKLKEKGWIKSTDRVLFVNSGNGFVYADSIKVWYLFIHSFVHFILLSFIYL